MICPVCNKEEIGTNRRKYCSDKCSHRARKRRASGKPIADDLDAKRCPVCGNMFTPSRNGHNICSKKCTTRAFLRAMVGKPTPDLPPTYANCAYCGEQFVKEQSKPRQRCCSRSCIQSLWYVENKEKRRVYMREYMRRRNAR